MTVCKAPSSQMRKRHFATVFVAIDAAAGAVDAAEPLLADEHPGELTVERCGEYAERADVIAKRAAALAVALRTTAASRTVYSPADADVTTDDTWFAVFDRLTTYDARRLGSTCWRLTTLLRVRCRALFIRLYPGTPSSPPDPFIPFSSALTRVSFAGDVVWTTVSYQWAYYVKDPETAVLLIDTPDSRTENVARFRLAHVSPRVRAPRLAVVTPLYATKLLVDAARRVFSRVEPKSIRRLAVHWRCVRDMAILFAGFTSVEQLIVYAREGRDDKPRVALWLEFVALPPPSADGDVARQYARNAFTTYPNLRQFVWCWVPYHGGDTPWKRISAALLAPCL